MNFSYFSIIFLDIFVMMAQIINFSHCSGPQQSWHHEIVTDLVLGVASGSGRATTTWDAFLEARPLKSVDHEEWPKKLWDIMENIW